LRATLSVGRPPVARTYSTSEVERLPRNFLLTRAQCLLARSDLRRQCLWRFALNRIEQLHRRSQPFLGYAWVASIMRTD
jgi:hypothetical protein